MKMSGEYKKECTLCGKIKYYSSKQSFNRGANLCYSCANKNSVKSGEIRNFIRLCSICGTEVIYPNSRSYNISMKKYVCICETCRATRFSRECPSCKETIKTSKPIEPHINCKKCESLKRITEKKGYGFSGVYNGIHFRSSLELSFMMNEHRKWKSGECSEFAIPYYLNGKLHTYYPDFVVENEVIECKPAYAQKGEIFEAKRRAAVEWCNERGLSYIIIDPKPISKELLLELHNQCIITLTSKSLTTISEKLNNGN